MKVCDQHNKSWVSITGDTGVASEKGEVKRVTCQQACKRSRDKRSTYCTGTVQYEILPQVVSNIDREIEGFKLFPEESFSFQVQT